jgi:hypothetical protein
VTSGYQEYKCRTATAVAAETVKRSTHLYDEGKDDDNLRQDTVKHL